MTHDVIVVGAGPSGSIVAHDCARAGLKTLLLEKWKLPRDKPCGGAVMYRGLRILRGNIPKHLIEQKIHGLRFGLPSGDAVEFSSEKLIGITVMRNLFDEFLARRAVTAGAELVEEARVKKASTTNTDTTVVLADGREYKSHFLVGADGVNSVVAQSLGLRSPKKNLQRVGLGMESDFYVGKEGVMNATDGNPTVLEICPVEGRVSYGWVFPKREHLAIGIAGAAAHMYPLRPAFDAFCKKTEKRLGLKLDAAKRRTYFLGADGLMNRNVMDRVLLVGDAAGFVDPMMGEGIAYAMKSGVYAAEVIVGAMASNRFDEDYLMQFHRLCKREFGANFALAERAGLRGTHFAETILKMAASYHLASDIMTRIARGEMGYADIPYTVVKSIPREIPRILQRRVRQRIVNSS